MAKQRPRRSPKRWSLQDAKNKLSEVVDGAVSGVPQIVTRRGQETAVVISYEAYQAMTAPPPKQSLAEYLLEIPTSVEDEELERIQLDSRDIDL